MILGEIIIAVSKLDFAHKATCINKLKVAEAILLKTPGAERLVTATKKTKAKAAPTEPAVDPMPKS